MPGDTDEYREKLKLSDLGERAVIEQVLRPRYVRGAPTFGDDCAISVLPASAGWLAATTDPCPLPAAWILGYTDYYYFGWLLATINLSDLAASGAVPLGLLTSLQLPADTSVADFERLLDGIDDCCATCGTKVLGGNLKEAPKVDLTATALGTSSSKPLSRSGARVSDDVYVVGGFGEFWAGFLGESRFTKAPAETLGRLRPSVVTPRPLVQEGITLRESNLVTACMDNSDGLIPSLRLLAEASQVEIILELEDVTPSQDVLAVAEVARVDWWRFAIGWGDWNLLITVPTIRSEEILSLARSAGMTLRRIGSCRQGRGLTARLHGREGTPVRLESERFAADSWFKTGIDAYADSLLRLNIIEYSF